MAAIYLMLIGLFLWLHPNFKGKHPYPMIALSILSEAIFFSIGNLNQFICPLKLPELLTYTLKIDKLISGSETFTSLASTEKNFKSIMLL